MRPFFFAKTDVTAFTLEMSTPLSQSGCGEMLALVGSNAAEGS